MSKNKIEDQFKEAMFTCRTNAIDAYEHGEKEKTAGNLQRERAEFKVAYDSFLVASQAGDAISAGYLGRMYQNGYVPDTSDADYNFGRAVVWYVRAIKLCEAKGGAVAEQEKAVCEGKLSEMLNGKTLVEFGLTAEDVDPYVVATREHPMIPDEMLARFYDNDEINGMGVPAGTTIHGAQPAAGGPAAAAGTGAVAAPQKNGCAVMAFHVDTPVPANIYESFDFGNKLRVKGKAAPKIIEVPWYVVQEISYDKIVEVFKQVMTAFVPEQVQEIVQAKLSGQNKATALVGLFVDLAASVTTLPLPLRFGGPSDPTPKDFGGGGSSGEGDSGSGDQSMQLSGNSTDSDDNITGQMLQQSHTT